MSASNQDHQYRQLVQQVAPQSKLLRAWPLQGGMSAEMTALEIERPDGRTRKLIVRQPEQGALRQNPRAAEDEFRLLQIAQSAGLAVPAPYFLDASGQIFSTPYLVIEYVEGEPDFAPADRIGCVRQLATHLARIHSLEGSNPDLAFLPRRANRCPELSGKRPARVDRSWEEGRIRATLAAASPLPQRNAPVLLHGDYWPGNTLWREGQLVAVIDWEDACVGDPLADLGISRLDLAWILGVEAMAAFTEHYRSLRAVDDVDLPYWDLCAALRLARLAGPHLAEWAAFYAPYGRHDITEDTIREQVRFFVAQALEGLTVL